MHQCGSASVSRIRFISIVTEEIAIVPSVYHQNKRRMARRGFWRRGQAPRRGRLKQQDMSSEGTPSCPSKASLFVRSRSQLLGTHRGQRSQ